MSKPLYPQWWDRFWFADEAPYTIGLWRICFGSLLTLLYMADLPNWHKIYGHDGAYPLADFLRTRSLNPSLFTISVQPESIWVWYVIGLLAALAFTVGFKSRVAAVALFLVTASAFLRNSIWATGHEAILLPLLFFAMFLPLSNAYSLDQYLATRPGKIRRPPNSPHFSRWPLRLMQITIGFLYFFGGLSKLLDGVAWRDGTAISIVALSPSWFRYPDLALFQNIYVSSFLTYSTIVFELSFIWLVWHTRLRPFVLLAALSFHLGLLFFMEAGIVPFNLTMIVSLILFLEPGQIQRLLSALRRMKNAAPVPKSNS